jgi:putative protein kinase ArgK-like GTPase of G3E family
VAARCSETGAHRPRLGDEGSFVRSMAARDRLGGLADQTLAAMVVMRALFDRVLIETVGVGQSETDVAGVPTRSCSASSRAQAIRCNS